MTGAGPLLPALSGLGTGLSLIVAIGAQNAHVLRQGLRHEHVGQVVAICALSDLVLIVAGVLGIGVVMDRAGWLVTATRFVGALFLLAYGLVAGRRALRADRLAAEVGGRPASLRRVALTTAALTWLNPHVYLDTVVLLGSIANSVGPQGRWAFAAGAGLGSSGWFGALGYGARLLSGVFARARAWQVLDLIIAVVMVTLGTRLIMD